MQRQFDRAWFHIDRIHYRANTSDSVNATVIDALSLTLRNCLESHTYALARL